MTLFRTFLAAATFTIFAISIYVITTWGINWPAVYFGDLMNLDWRSQFNTDLLIALSLLAIWITWREGFTAKGYLFGVLTFFFGFMFVCPYLLLATYKVNGDPKALLLGLQVNS